MIEYYLMKIYSLFSLKENQDLKVSDLQKTLSNILLEMENEIKTRADERVKKALKLELQELISKL